MFQIRIHGRGGQGVVSAAEMLSVAAFLEGRFAQAFPSFGSERMGAPVMAFCRIDDKEIRLREPVLDPDALIVQDPTLLHQVDLFKGLRRTGYILINSTRGFDELGMQEFVRGFRPSHLCAIAATELALKHVGRAVPNVPLLAGFAAITREVKLDSVIAAIREKFPPAVADRNVAAATEAYATSQRKTESSHAQAD
ncbi:MAG TPA: 2-oxoacid:acceptor oxidoreductase family protein [Casimicrobiaceae bacterium]|nr:2-oxoacid:acceptor oxidoreductase family protein [Casimicrobiaceae bacterium]